MRRALRFLALSPLALALVSCGGGDDATTGAQLDGEPIAAIPAPEGQDWTDTVVKTEEGGFRMGNPDAPIKVLEFASLTCHVCADFSNDGAAEIKELVASGRVSYEYRNYLRAGPDLIGTQIMECGNPERVIPLAEQHFARFEEFSNSFSDPRLQQIQNLPPEQQKLAFAEVSGLLDFFAQRGISRDEAASCLADQAKATELSKQSQQWAQNYDITGTPTLYVNGKKFEETKWSRLKQRLEAMGAR